MTWRDLFRVHEECDWYPMMKEAELEAMAETSKSMGSGTASSIGLCKAS